MHDSRYEFRNIYIYIKLVNFVKDFGMACVLFLPSWTSISLTISIESSPTVMAVDCSIFLPTIVSSIPPSLKHGADLGLTLKISLSREDYR